MEKLSQIEEINQKIKDYKEIILSFSALLNEENRALEQFDTDTVGALYEQKCKIVTAYRGMVAYFIKNQTILNSLDDEKKQDLKEVSVNLDKLLQENDTLLKTRMETSQSIMNTIVNIAKAANNANSTSYGAQGKYSPLDNSKNAIAINRTL